MRKWCFVTGFSLRMSALGHKPFNSLTRGQLKQWLAAGKPPYPDAFMAGLDHFVTQQYFEAHEVWEDLWRQTPPDISDRQFYHACIQLAVAWHHHHHNNPVGATNLLNKAMARFSALSSLPRYQFMAPDFESAQQQILM
jgi:Domain of unknown function (DUF309)